MVTGVRVGAAGACGRGNAGGEWRWEDVRKMEKSDHLVSCWAGRIRRRDAWRLFEEWVQMQERARSQEPGARTQDRSGPG